MSSAVDVTQSSIDESMKRIYLIGEVNDSMVQLAIPAIKCLDAIDSGLPISVHLMTDGGSLSCAFAIYDVLRATQSNVYTAAHGDVLSAGVSIFLAGDERFVGRNTSMMMHRPFSPSQTAHLGEYQKTEQYLAALEARVEQILADAGCPLAFGPLKDMTFDVWIHGSHALISSGIATLRFHERKRLSAD